MLTDTNLLSRIRRRLAGEGGFTMIIALGVLVVTSLLLTATFVAITGDAHLSQSDLDGKRAYAAAQAGLNAYLYQLNQNSTYWQTCSNDTVSWTSVPGNTSGEQYQYVPVPANGNTACNSSNVIGTMIDTNSGGLTIAFEGRAGTGNQVVYRGIVATFKRKTPLSYLWYTKYETDDPIIPGFSACGNLWYRQGRPSTCEINWVTGDHVNGPMYTQDQLYVASGQSPTFGRSGSNDQIATLATNSMCDAGCGSATFSSTPLLGQSDPIPSSNSQLLTDAQTYGKVYTGVTTITLNGTKANVTNCPTSSTCTTTSNLDLTQYPIIYVQNGTGCGTLSASQPTAPVYSSSGCNGDVYISGSYTTSLTVAAANDIMLAGSLTTSGSGSTLTGNAVLGLIANRFVRVEHSCIAPVVAQSDPVYDAAILALQHSFIVDDYSCGAQLGNLTVNGAIVQMYRGPVGTSGGTGYLKAYSYDDRLQYLAPPYLFDILNAAWTLSRENSCTVNPVASEATSEGC